MDEPTPLSARVKGAAADHHHRPEAPAGYGSTGDEPPRLEAPLKYKRR
jgi:hypothetical protein